MSKTQEELSLNVKRRETVGKNNNRRLRKAGEVPAVVYGDGRETLAIQVDDRHAQRLLRDGGDNAVFLLALEGTDQQRHAMVRDIQYDALTGRLVHIDFMRIDLSQKVKVNVPVSLVGVPEGVKNEGGIVDFITRELEVECLPTAIPTELEIDISELHIGQHVEAGAIELPDGVELLEDPTRTLASVNIPKLSIETEDEEELEEGAEEAAGDEAAEAASTEGEG